MPNTYACNWCFQSKCSNISAEGLHFSAFHFCMGISKYGVSIRTHVTEGICIPLVAKPDLIRNVTILGCGTCGPGRST